MEIYNNKSNDVPLQPITAVVHQGPSKEDLATQPAVDKQKSLKLLQKFSALTIALSGCSFIHSCLSLAHFPSQYNVISLGVGLLTLAMSISLAFWSTWVLKDEKGLQSETFLQNFYIALMLRAAGSLPFIANMMAQGGDNSESIFTFENATISDNGTILTNIGTILPLLELIICIVFVQGARTVFSHITERGTTMSRLISAGNLTLLGSSLGLIFFAPEAMGYEKYYNLSEQFPSWIASSLRNFGTLTALLTGFIWLFNYKKWRAPTNAVGSILGVVSLILGIFSICSFAYSSNLQGLHAKPFLSISTFGSFAAVSGLLILMGVLYYEHIEWVNLKTSNKGDYKWLAMLAGIVLVFFVATSMSATKPYSANGLEFTNIQSNDPDVDFPLLASYDGSDYQNVFNTLMSKRYRFITLKRDTYNANNIKLDAGPWDWIFSDFAKSIDPYVEQVGFIFLGQTGSERLYMVVFNPKYQNKNAAQVLEGFRLPTDPRILQKWGLPVVNYYTTRDVADLTLGNLVMKSQSSGVVSFLADSSALEMPSMLASYDGADYQNIFNTLLSKRYRFILLKRDTYNTNNIKLDAGPWDWLFYDFANAVDPYVEQVGFIFLGQPGSERLYMIVFNPKYQNKNAAQVLEGFRLPTEPKILQKWGLPIVNYFTTRDKNELTLENVIMRSQNTGAVSLIEDEITSLISDDGVEDFAMFAAHSGPNHLQVLNELAQKSRRFVLFYRDQNKGPSPRTAAAPWDWKFNQLPGFVKPNIGQVAFVWIGEKEDAKLYMIVINPSTSQQTIAEVLKAYSLPADPQELKQYGLPEVHTLVVSDKRGLVQSHVVSQSKSGGVISFLEQSPEIEDLTLLATYDGADYQNVFNTLLSKRYRFITLKRDTYNTNNIKLDAGPWEWLFSDFVNTIDPYVEQIGFIFLGQPGSEKLYMIVFNPKYQNKNAAQILEDFRLPTEPKILQKWGLPIVNYFTTRDKTELTLDNLILKSKTSGVVSFIDDDDSLSTLKSVDASLDELLQEDRSVSSSIRRAKRKIGVNLLSDDDSLPTLNSVDNTTEVHNTTQVQNNTQPVSRRDIVRPISDEDDDEFNDGGQLPHRMVRRTRRGVLILDDNDDYPFLLDDADTN